MTGKAIDLLSKNSAGKRKGFFLQVESASIDKKDHAADACGQIGETQQIDEAVSKALDFARKDGNTLVIVTADHAHTSQIVDGNTPGLTAKLATKDGLGDDRGLRHLGRAGAASSTRAPRCGSPATARPRPTWSG